MSRTTQKAWNKDVKEIQNGLDQLDIAINRIEDDLYNALKNLMAISSESVAATFARVKDSALCSVEIDLDGQEIWNKEISEIKESLYNFESIKNQAENELLDALIQMNEKFRDSSAFNEIIPEDEVGVYSALESLGYEDVDYKFRKTLRELFQFQELAGMFVH